MIARQDAETQSRQGIISRIKRYFQSSYRRAEMLAEARKLLAQMDEHWAVEARKSFYSVWELLIRLGLAHLRAMKAGQDAAKRDLAAMQKRLKEARWTFVNWAHRN